MPFYEPRRVPLPSCFAAEECQSAHGELKRCHSFPGYITFSMAKGYTEACTHDDIETISDTQEDVLAMGCEDPSPQVWPDTDEELDLGVNMGNHGNALTSAYFPKPCENICMQPAGSVGADSAIIRKPVSWADIEDEVSIEPHTPGIHSTMTVPEPCQTLWSQPEASAGHTLGSHSTAAFPEPCPTFWSQSETSAGYVSGGDANAVPLADVAGYPGDVEALSGTRPLLLNLESALSTPLAPQGTTNLHAQSHPSSSLWLPHLLKQASAQVLTSPDTPHSCTSVSLQSTAVTPFSRAFHHLGSALSESETTTPQSQGTVTSFKMQGMATAEGPTFSFDDSASCLGASVPNGRVPVAVGPRDQSSKKATNAKPPGVSGPSTRSSMQEGKAIGALALKKARSMLPAVNLKPSADPGTPGLKVASASPSSISEGHVKSRTADGAQAVQRPLPTLLQSRRGDGMPKSKLSPGQVKPDEIGIAC